MDRGIFRRQNLSVSVKCPNCGKGIQLEEMPEGKSLRCRACLYPFVKHSDLMLLVNGCIRNKAEQNVQRSRTEQILVSLAPYVPEAAEALGGLGSLNEKTRWSYLQNAYAAGVESAAEGLEEICRREPGQFLSMHCPTCGARVYTERQQSENAVCLFCGRSLSERGSKK